MSPNPSLLICAAAWAALSAPLAAVAAPPGRTFDGAYALLKTRNIFDPERQPGAAAPTQAAVPVTKGDFAALTGILVTDDKVLAFFSGSRAEFNAVLGPQGVIAGATITRITPHFIEILRDGKIIPVAVGQTVPLSADAAPAPMPSVDAAATAPTPTAPIPPSTTPSSQPVTNISAPASAAPASPGGVDREAIMRRMMQKRQQDLK
ncbi:MAG: hypothetical protein ACFUZC_06515 [Chthoniobacteraceae bacterium]